MSIVSGLVHSLPESQSRAGSRHQAIGEWAIRNAWAILVAGSLIFWAAFAALIYLA